MINPFEFECPFCGEEFGSEVINLAKHIGDEHDPSRKEEGTE